MLKESGLLAARSKIVLSVDSDGNINCIMYIFEYLKHMNHLRTAISSALATNSRDVFKLIKYFKYAHALQCVYFSCCQVPLLCSLIV